MPGGLVLGGATSDRVSFAANAAHDNLTVFTMWGWMYPTTATDFRRFVEKANASNVAAWHVLRAGSPDANTTWIAAVLRSTTDSEMWTADFTLNEWQFLAMTYDEGAAQGIRIFRGTLSTAVAECSYASTANGSGTSNTSDGPLTFGNRASTANRAFQGNLGPCGLHGVVLTTAQLESLRRRPRKTVGANVALEFGRPGKNGADWIDYTGLTGTVTGATQGNGPPLVQADDCYQQNGSRLYTQVA